MRVLLTISLLFSLNGLSFAQDLHVIDSLKQVIEEVVDKYPEQWTWHYDRWELGAAYA